MRSGFTGKIVRFLSYVLVAVLASALTFYLCLGTNGSPKLLQLEQLIRQRFVGEVDEIALEDGAAEGMIAALGDRWSYYIPADQYQANEENLKNAYVGIGITIRMREDQTGFDIVLVEPNGGAKAAGILPGDVLIEVERKSVVELGVDGTRELIRGEADTQVEVTVLRAKEQLTMSVTRQTIQVQVATGVLLEENIGLVTIVNFNDRCAQETIAAIETLQQQGATKLIFDVRFNPGGYKSELVDLLDYLLPEGDVFRSVYSDGKETVDTSDASQLEMPMAVLMNGDSYSAAEFFAAALDEYDKAVLVGEPTVGKGNFQNTFKLIDGSGVALSVGKYYTPKGVCLADVGGLQPEVSVPVEEELAAQIYAGLLEPAEDPQIQAAIAALK